MVGWAPASHAADSVRLLESHTVPEHRRSNSQVQSPLSTASVAPSQNQDENSQTIRVQSDPLRAVSALAKDQARGRAWKGAPGSRRETKKQSRSADAQGARRQKLSYPGTRKKRPLRYPCRPDSEPRDRAHGLTDCAGARMGHNGPGTTEPHPQTQHDTVPCRNKPTNCFPLRNSHVAVKNDLKSSSLKAHQGEADTDTEVIG